MGNTIACPLWLRNWFAKHLAEKILTSKAALEGERKQVTVLFADLKGSMELLADRDPEGARMLLDPVIEHMMEAVHRYEGTVNQVMGDGIMALFGAPLVQLTAPLELVQTRCSRRRSRGTPGTRQNRQNLGWAVRHRADGQERRVQDARARSVLTTRADLTCFEFRCFPDRGVAELLGDAATGGGGMPFH